MPSRRASWPTPPRCRRRCSPAPWYRGWRPGRPTGTRTAWSGWTSCMTTSMTRSGRPPRTRPPASGPSVWRGNCTSPAAAARSPRPHRCRPSCGKRSTARWPGSGLGRSRNWNACCAAAMRGWCWPPGWPWNSSPTTIAARWPLLPPPRSACPHRCRQHLPRQNLRCRLRSSTWDGCPSMAGPRNIASGSPTRAAATSTRRPPPRRAGSSSARPETSWWWPWTPARPASMRAPSSSTATAEPPLSACTRGLTPPRRLPPRQQQPPTPSKSPKHPPPLAPARNRTRPSPRPHRPQMRPRFPGSLAP